MKVLRIKRRMYYGSGATAYLPKTRIKTPAAPITPRSFERSHLGDPEVNRLPPWLGHEAADAYVAVRVASPTNSTTTMCDKVGGMPTARLNRVDRVVVDRAVVDSTLRVLKKFGKHRLEGLVLWLGNIDPGTAHVTKVFVPDQHPVADEDGVGYFVGGETLFELNRGLAETGLRLIAQVHSHPGSAYHSETDDRYAIVTADGGLSLVVPNFGRSPADPAAWAVYRLSRRQWCELATEERKRLFAIRGDK